MRTQHRAWVYGDHINTDMIFAGKYTYTLKTPESIASKALEDLDPLFQAQAGPGDVIIAGRNWGCGSSREQAVTALKYRGIVAIIAESFNGLYYRNCINQGIYPLVCPQLRQRVRMGETIQLDLTVNQIVVDAQTFTAAPFSEGVRAILAHGGLLPMLRAQFSGQP